MGEGGVNYRGMRLDDIPEGEAREAEALRRRRKRGLRKQRMTGGVTGGGLVNYRLGEDIKGAGFRFLDMARTDLDSAVEDIVRGGGGDVSSEDLVELRGRGEAARAVALLAVYERLPHVIKFIEGVLSDVGGVHTAQQLRFAERLLGILLGERGGDGKDGLTVLMEQWGEGSRVGIKTGAK